MPEPSSNLPALSELMSQLPAATETPEQPTPKTGRGSQAMYGAMATTFIAAVYAVINAGSEFYTDPGVLTAIGAFLGAVVVFFGGRTSQVNRLVDQAKAIAEQNVARLRVLEAAYNVELNRATVPGTTPTPDPTTPPDEGTTPSPGTEG